MHCHLFVIFYKDNEYCRKDKSLGVLSQKFLMMFLVSEVCTMHNAHVECHLHTIKACLVKPGLLSPERNLAPENEQIEFYNGFK